MATCKITLAFKVGDYGWSENYYKTLVSPGDFSSLEPIVRELAVRRLRICGAAVLLDFARLSDVDVRRDADDLFLNYFTIDGGAITTFPGGLVTVVKTAITGIAVNPNLAIVCRVEASNKVYHSAHFLSGFPKPLVTQDEVLIEDPTWRSAFNSLANYLITQNFQFPALNRTDVTFEDRKVTDLSSAAGSVDVDTTGWNVGDRIRVIQARIPRGERVRSIVGNIAEKTGTRFVYQGESPVPLGTRVGPKTIAHKEVTSYQFIRAFADEHVSHRNRGRPLNSPRGRRRR